ncbi:5-(carboxyamino)imidazole ribonucleotide synthase [Corynebacterium argentoratense]|uniref:5-(carboxyamino)imidazole ribonucleotide synthase n=1 Tax=Corynebacterium argentoratense TaxID=42817 RepID=UPI001F3BC08A|nr:5-(carboxyamino)imidazole ribonucleotide synthase [Corynebacterium argentoratense]MCF1765637.1 5-(carboxyamino)imidazole ribonucleotide synthase [Corynebacterium argentoratense]
MTNVTVIGDGQLARMMQPAAIELGLTLRVLAGSPDASAAQVIPEVIPGDYTSLEDLQRAAEGSDAITFDHEHVPTEHLRALQSAGINVHPGPEALIYAQDKLLMRERLRELGAPVPEFAAINSIDDALAFSTQVGGQVCLKARRGGYDGKGVWFPEGADIVALVGELLDAGTPLMAERKVDLARELSALCARSATGEVRSWPVADSVQKDGVCYTAQAPAAALPQPWISERLGSDAPAGTGLEALTELAEYIATSLDVTGVLAVELFQEKDGRVLVNELAMRPHNTGHWTQDGSVTSQFEQHLRAVLGWPLGDTALLAPTVVMANTLGDTQGARDVMKLYPDVKVHVYGKQARPGRKVGHVNLCGTDPDATLQRATEAAAIVVNGINDAQGRN